MRTRARPPASARSSPRPSRPPRICAWTPSSACAQRIAEGDRAAANRVQAAEAEALEILAAAQEQADKMLTEAKQQAQEITEDARRQAREVVNEAGAASREVLRDGTELSGHLRELSGSLRTNAELLLRDIRLAHAEMTARLDQARAGRHAARPGVDDLDVPEFHPGASSEQHRRAGDDRPEHRGQADRRREDPPIADRGVSISPVTSGGVRSGPSRSGRSLAPAASAGEHRRTRGRVRAPRRDDHQPLYDELVHSCPWPGVFHSGLLFAQKPERLPEPRTLSPRPGDAQGRTCVHGALRNPRNVP